VVAGLALALGLPAVIAPAPAAAACANPVACENTRPGTPQSVWDIGGGNGTSAGDPSLQGFATSASVTPGQTVGFKISDTTSAAYHLDIYRMGYYQGNGARLITTVSPSSAGPQPACPRDGATGLVDCGNWGVSATWTVPGDAVSGIYFAHLVRAGGDSHIFFVVRDDSSHSGLLFQTDDETWAAYNAYGGASLYTGNGPGSGGRAYKVSYNRPNDVRGGQYRRTWLMDDQYPMVRFLEANGYDVSYLSGLDTATHGGLLLQHRTFLSVGHDEYWSGSQRTSVEAARDDGVNLAFFSGNEMFWKTRWEPSIDGSNTPNRTLVTYKESIPEAMIDPQDPPTWTGTWRDPTFSPLADGGRPENAVTGTQFNVNCCNFLPIQLSAEDAQLRVWRDTPWAAGASLASTPGLVGYETDTDPDNGFRPAGEIDLSSTHIANGNILQGYGDTYVNGSATHHVTYHRAAGGGLVFGAGTIHWSWGLDATHDNSDGVPGVAADPNIEQATVNVLADMGATASTLQGGLVQSGPPTLRTPPTSHVTSPPNGVYSGTVTVTGTAAAAAGGHVGGVEVSLDGGATWHPAAGRSSWSYTRTLPAPTALTIRSRATDDSLNTEVQTCPCTLFGPAAVPAVASVSDPNPVELGLKFRSDTAGTITGVRFYKGSQNTGSHTGSLWSATGSLLASVRFTGETASGWQQATFATPVAIAAGTTYVVSYHTDTGHYAADTNAFAAQGADNPPLHAIGDSANPNGVYSYGAGGFPQSATATNYWVDPVLGATISPPPSTSSGYWMLGSTGSVYSFGAAEYHGGAVLPGGGTTATHIEPTPDGKGYWVVSSRGGVYSFGDAGYYGASPALGVFETVTSLSGTASGRGYWLFTNRGRVFAYGDARFFGDMAAVRLNGPVLDSVRTASGNGYYMVASDGGIFTFGDARFLGSMGGKHLNGPVVGLAPDSTSGGYWLVASDGGIFAFGGAQFHGSMGGRRLNRPVIGMVAFGNGYLMVASDGGIFDFSDKPFVGSLGANPPANPIVGVAPLDN